MSFEEELEQIDREEWLAKFDDKQIMMAARMSLEWLYHLPDDWQPKEYTELDFNNERTTRTTIKTVKSIAATEKRNRYANNRKEDGIRKVLYGQYYYEYI